MNVKQVGKFRFFSFMNEFFSGYKFDSDSHQCVDSNECASPGSSPCSGLAQCVNTPGSFYCKCPPGYKLDITGSDCRDVNECQVDKSSFNL